MPITNHPFTSIGPGCSPRPLLPIEISNPATNLAIKTWGLIDTGTDECCVPAAMADPLGHVLHAGNMKEIIAGDGIATAYSHTTNIKIYCLDGEGFETQRLVHIIEDTPIDFMPNLNTVLLGAKDFLSMFVLEIDYPNLSFSIQKR